MFQITLKRINFTKVYISVITCITKGDAPCSIALHAGNRTSTMLFEGQADHLIPSTSQVLVQSDLFKMAGRMIGHSFLHGGPPLTGVSPAILHVLLGGSRETATIVLEDVADIDIRETIQLVGLERNAKYELNHMNTHMHVTIFIYLVPTMH